MASERYSNHLTRLKFDPEYAAKHAAKRARLNARYQETKRLARLDPEYREAERLRAKELRELRAKYDPAHPAEVAAEKIRLDALAELHTRMKG